MQDFLSALFMFSSFFRSLLRATVQRLATQSEGKMSLVVRYRGSRGRVILKLLLKS